MAGAILLGFATVSFTGFRFGLVTWHFSHLLQYQIDKLEQAPAVDILLVGDSALGNAIDAAAWSQALQRPVLSAALTGTYGYGGSYNMIRRALRRHAVKTVVVFNTMKLMARTDPGQGALFTAETWSDLATVRPAAVSALLNLATPINIAASFFRARESRFAAYAASDYVPQSKALSELLPKPPERPPVDAAGISSDHWPFLSAIGALCGEKGLRCLYVHGPVGEWECGSSDTFVAAVNEVASAAGLTPVAGSPVCMTWADTGDAEDHVHPGAKAGYSARYLSLVAPYLSGVR